MSLWADGSPAPINPSDFAPEGDFDYAGNGGDWLIALLAWCVSAAAVAGVIIVGTQLALQLRRGEPGEGATYFRGLAFVLGACVIGISAGPVVGYVLGVG
ncbi:hypothetical protein AB0465_23155 [Streptomyces griseoviridis]|uniref:DUF4190 domain-containing protein n=1 Tax=Streptomyces hintoniae TaxID=3075521 RepID=A0ABU2UCG0_9ACTN|nr:MULTISPECIES: hypothetical protein [unclassified Streptomyces]MDH6700088.1 hypothetical protein [Streptomyces sp. MAA16]MDT0470833.1 hypothetical protein [Streptomyces sp. DSM 41014]